jgi:DNA polymerase/3'-5' exonuclease PolX
MKGLRRDGINISGGKTEKEILEMLGVEYKEPEDRNS